MKKNSKVKETVNLETINDCVSSLVLATDMKRAETISFMFAVAFYLFAHFMLYCLDQPVFAIIFTCLAGISFLASYRHNGFYEKYLSDAEKLFDKLEKK